MINFILFYSTFTIKSLIPISINKPKAIFENNGYVHLYGCITLHMVSASRFKVNNIYMMCNLRQEILIKNGKLSTALYYSKFVQYISLSSFIRLCGIEMTLQNCYIKITYIHVWQHSKEGSIISNRLKVVLCDYYFECFPRTYSFYGFTLKYALLDNNLTYSIIMEDMLKHTEYASYVTICNYYTCKKSILLDSPIKKSIINFNNDTFLIFDFTSGQIIVYGNFNNLHSTYILIPNTVQKRYVYYVCKLIIRSDVYVTVAIYRDGLYIRHLKTYNYYCEIFYSLNDDQLYYVILPTGSSQLIY